jgi:hypothetical protein
MGKIAVFFRSKPGALAADGGDNTGTGWTTDAHQTWGRGGYRRVSSAVKPCNTPSQVSFILVSRDFVSLQPGSLQLGV